MLAAIEALDVFIEASRRLSKQKVLRPITRRLERALKPAFALQARAFGRAFTSTDRLDSALDAAYKASAWAFVEPIQATARAGLQAGGDAVLSHLGMREAAVKPKLRFDLKNPRAVNYLKDHGADLVKKIDETTRAEIKAIIEYATSHGWSYAKTAAAIQAKYKGYYDTGSWWNFDAPRPQLHIDSRAHLIAVQESAQAYETGNFAVIQDLIDGGLQMEKSWSTMNDDRVSEICRANQEEGWIPADQAHSSGHMHPTAHVACRCDELYRAKE